MMYQKDQNQTPLVDALLEYTSSPVIVSFDVPGHKRRLQDFPEKYKSFEAFYRRDVNSLKALDFLNQPTSVIAEAQALYADFYECDEAFFIVNGSTAGVQLMILAAVGPNEKILLPRNVHKSALNALILTGAIPVYITPQVDEKNGISLPVSFEDVYTAFQEHPDISTVFLIHPTYFGMVGEIEKIIKYVHTSTSATVLVDQAHGSHFSFSKQLPSSASALGADLTTISMHKTGGALTQASVLLHNEGRISKEHVQSTINIMQTTSASYLLMASLDIARHYAYTHQKQQEQCLKDTLRYAQMIDSLSGFSVYSANSEVFESVSYDALKLCINVRELGYTGYEMYEIFRDQYDIQLELGETYVILAIISIGDDHSSLEKLYQACKDISEKYTGKYKTQRKEILSESLEHFVKMTPREAFFKSKELVVLDYASHRISGETLMVYPPGMPIISLGEEFTNEIIHYIKNLLEQGLECVGMTIKEGVPYVQVITEVEIGT